MNEFNETQKFNQWWVWAIIFITDIIALLFLYNFISEFWSKNLDFPIVISFILIIFTVIAVNAIFIYSKLITKITPEGIYIKYIPFHFKFKKYNWEELEKIYVREYSPIGEYGGWGYRFSITGKGRAYNTSGNMGLQLNFINGKKLLIGTQNSIELKDYLIQIDKYKE